MNAHACRYAHTHIYICVCVQPAGAEDFGRYVPGLFRLPIAGITPGVPVRARITYLDTLSFAHGNYTARVPLVFPEEVLMGRMANQFVRIVCYINAGTPHCKVGFFGCIFMYYRDSSPLHVLYKVGATGGVGPCILLP